jgi:hypothetical protein
MELVGRPDRPTHKFAAAIRAAAVQNSNRADPTERAFK